MPRHFSHPLDKRFHEALYGLKVKPSRQLWPQIEQRLSQRHLTFRRTSWLALVLLLGFLPAERQGDVPSHLMFWKQADEKIVLLKPEPEPGVSEGSDLPEVRYKVGSVEAQQMPVLQADQQKETIAPLTKTVLPLPQQEHRQPAAAAAFDFGDDVCPKRWFAGLMIQLNNNWLLDHRLMGSSGIRYQLTLGASYGVVSGMDLIGRWGLQYGLVHTLGAGQRYENREAYGRSVDMDFIQKKIALSYVHVPLLVQYHQRRYSSSLQRPLRINYSAGIQYGRLIHYSIDQAKGSMEQNIALRVNELSAVAGLDWNLINDDGTFYTIGFRATLGTPVFKPQMEHYYELQRARNVALSLHAAVNLSRCAPNPLRR
ncbi:MAG: PorT family protein [Chitinophagales bacterium]|nr:PorT family protein [Chitinophagales bacterium]